MYYFSWKFARVSILCLAAFTSALNVSIVSILDGNFIFLSLELPRSLNKIVGWAPGITGLDKGCFVGPSVFGNCGMLSAIDDLLN